jgi:O-antigen ligase
MMEPLYLFTRICQVPLPVLDHIIRGLLLVYVFALPFTGLLFIERNGFLLLLVLLVLWCGVQRRLFFVRTPLDLPLIAFVAWVGLTISFATYPLYSLKEYGKLLQQGLLFYVVLFFYQEKAQWTQLIWVFVGASFVVSLYGVTQFDSEDVLAVTSFLTSEVWLVTYLIMMVPLSFALAWHEERPWLKGLYGLAALLSSSCLLLTQSRAGLLAFLVELWACVWLIKRRAMVILAGTITVLLIVVSISLIQVVKVDDGTIRFAPRVSMSLKIGTHSLVHRLDIWAFMMARIAEHPIGGIGYGKETSKMLYGQTSEENLPAGHASVRQHGTHNLLLELALLVGLPGMLLFVWLAVRLTRTVFDGYRRTTDVEKRAVLLGVSVGMIGMGVRVMFDQMLVGTMAIQFWVLVAVALAASRPNNASVVPQSELQGFGVPIRVR